MVKPWVAEKKQVTNPGGVEHPILNHQLRNITKIPKEVNNQKRLQKHILNCV